MIGVIIAGGAGTRLWPLSTPAYPKHLLRVKGDAETLLQKTYARTRLLTDKIYIVSEAGHTHHLKDQLPDLPDEAFIIEPARRGTASCIIGALSYLADRHDPDEPIAILPADHYVQDNNGFEFSFRLAAGAAQQYKKIVLLGIEPYYASTYYGYIQKGKLIEEGKPVSEVKSFKEKPNHQTATSYIDSGEFLWNSGYFVASLNVFIDEIKQYAPSLYDKYQKLHVASPEEFGKIYLGLDTATIDYALIEHVKDLLVVPASFDWMDLGTYRELYKAVAKDNLGNHLAGNNVKTIEVENSYIDNHEKKPLVVIGLDDVVVINTKDGILVAKKDISGKVGDLSGEIN